MPSLFPPAICLAVGPFIQAFRIKLQSEYTYTSPLKMSGLHKALVSMIGVLAVDEARAFASKVCLSQNLCGRDHNRKIGYRIPVKLFSDLPSHPGVFVVLSPGLSKS